MVTDTKKKQHFNTFKKHYQLFSTSYLSHNIFRKKNNTLAFQILSVIEIALKNTTIIENDMFQTPY